VNFKRSVLNGAPQKLIRSIAEDLNISTLDLFELFRDQKARGLFLKKSFVADWIHLSDEGHELAAKAIIDHLNKVGI
jgi:lysophospholipase L1-like esterase